MYILCAIDAYKIEIPNIPLNTKTFWSEENQHKQKTTMALLSGIYDVEIDRIDSSEKSLAKRNIELIIK